MIRIELLRTRRELEAPFPVVRHRSAALRERRGNSHPWDSTRPPAPPRSGSSEIPLRKKSAWARLKWARAFDGAASTARRAAVSAAARESCLRLKPCPCSCAHNKRQHRPGIGMVRSLPDRQLQSRSALRRAPRMSPARSSRSCAGRPRTGSTPRESLPRTASPMLRGRIPFMSATVETIRGTSSSCSSKTISGLKARS